MSSIAASTTRPRRPALAAALPALGTGRLLGLGLGAALAAIAFGAKSAASPDQATWPEIAVVLAGALVAAISIVRAAATRQAWGAWSIGLMAALAALVGLSISWAVQPDSAWADTNMTLAYLAAFGGGVALVRLAPGRWEAVLSAVLIAAVALGGYAVLTKIIPESLAADEIASRLRAPFGYWNATGLMAALGLPACLWLGSRRQGHQALTALAYPALTLLLVAVMLSYSRGALVAIVFATAFWFAVSDRRVRAAAVLLVCAAGTAVVSLWAFSRDALTQTNVAIGPRSHDGHRLGVLLAIVLVLMLGTGLAVGFWAQRRPLAPLWRRRIGIGLITLLVVGAIGAILAVQSSNGGLSGQWHRLTDIHTVQPPNSPSRLTTIGSVRARYYHEALQIFSAHKWHGVGADGFGIARKHYSIDALSVQHAHSFLFQTLADFGLLGLFVTLALFAAWLVAARRPLHLRGPRPATPERLGMVTLAAIVLLYGVHSMLDWTWFVPGTTIPALVCAGWLAGRGRLTEAAAPRGATWSRDPLRIGAALAVFATALIVSYAILQPLRSVHSVSAAYAALSRGDYAAASRAAQRAHREDGLSVDPFFALADVSESAGDQAAATAALERAVRLQPRNPDTWSALGQHLLNDLHDPKAAVGPLGAAVYLDPNGLSGQRQLDFVTARQEAGQQ